MLFNEYLFPNNIVIQINYLVVSLNKKERKLIFGSVVNITVL